ncbi:hypothetical protein [Streptomyces sclerotialus]|uniref:hypothetical protein n=1 Tax=Streptomyces sclerotialus TaxID=1957 RepID=UPI000B238CB6
MALPPHTTLHGAQQRFGLADAEVDRQYGLVSVDPSQQLYALLVTEEAAERIRGMPGFHGPYANPRIEPFGPFSSDAEEHSSDAEERNGE